jgi:hypothetical protein
MPPGSAACRSTRARPVRLVPRLRLHERRGNRLVSTVVPTPPGRRCPGRLLAPRTPVQAINPPILPIVLTVMVTVAAVVFMAAALVAVVMPDVVPDSRDSLPQRPESAAVALSVRHCTRVGAGTRGRTRLRVAVTTVVAVLHLPSSRARHRRARAPRGCPPAIRPRVPS